jgi:hypothetical protein
MTALGRAGRVIAALGTDLLLAPDSVAAQNRIEYRVLSTTRTSTMQKEMQEAADAGFRFADVMGGSTKSPPGRDAPLSSHRGQRESAVLVERP